jgi:hypothetical protein
MKKILGVFAIFAARRSLLGCGGGGADPVGNSTVASARTFCGEASATTVETLRITATGVTAPVSIESNVGGQILKFSF